MKSRYVPRIALVAMAALALSACSSSGSDDNGCGLIYRRANLDCEDPNVVRAATFLNAMSVEEKVQQMSGPTYNPNNMFDQEDNERLGILGFRFMDGPRGVRWYNTDYGTTVFPVSEARASTWNLELERKIGKAMAREMRYLGRQVLLAPTINQVMHPRWGRAQETYGEDTFLLGEMGAALVRGIQHDPKEVDPAEPDIPAENTYRVIACVKHFAANNIDDTRIYVNAVVDDRTLHEVFLPHFLRTIAEKPGCVMSSYNRVNGTYAGYNKTLLRQILKTDWQYSGFVVSDWFAKGNTLSSPEAGLDIEMPFSSGPFPSMFDSDYYYGPALVSAVNSGQVDQRYVDEAVLRILHQKVEKGMMDHPLQWMPWLTKSDYAQSLALEAARQGIVLLKNGPDRGLEDDILPLDREAISKIAVVGMFANSENMGDKGSSDARVLDGELVITPFEGIRDAIEEAGGTAVTFTTVDGNEAAIASSDVVVVVTAYYYADLARSPAGEEGEWKDRESMNLAPRDLNNVKKAIALKEQNPNLKVIVVMKSGGAILVDEWHEGADAILMAWFAGMKEGTALAEILFGDVNPSGKVVQTFPKRESDLPPFDNTTTGDVVYDYYHGYRWMERHGIEPRYPFGHGLSYTTFSYSNLRVENPTVQAGDTLVVHVDVTNDGPRVGSEVVQLYVGYENTAVDDKWGRPVKELKGFARAENIAPGETRTVTIEVDTSRLGYWDVAEKRYVVERMEHQLYVGPSSDARDPNMQQGSFVIE